MITAIGGYNAQPMNWSLPFIKNREDEFNKPEKTYSYPNGLQSADTVVNNDKRPELVRIMAFAGENSANRLKVDADEQEKLLKRIGVKECKTCSERRYQDASNDPGVSFKSPTYINPATSGAVVSAHEQEHVQREQAKAQQEEREVISQSVRLFSSICPECGRSYVSGGETVTVTAAKKAYNKASNLLQNSNNASLLNIIA